MAQGSNNTEMFALSAPPPKELELRGLAYRLVRVFKHDFFAATCLYEASEPCDMPRVVVKIGRTRPFLGLGMGWLGEFMARHEEGIYRALNGLVGVPRWGGRIDRAGFAIEYIDALPLDHVEAVPDGFFDRLAALMAAVHELGVGYCDANKRSNILVGPAGEPYLVDYQLAVRHRGDWPWPASALSRAMVRYVQDKDLYHIYKHKRRLRPDELTEDQEALSRKRGGLHGVHRRLGKRWRALRRAFLRDRHKRGRLRSPTEQLEDHHQPEKATWRSTDPGRGRR